MFRAPMAKQLRLDGDRLTVGYYRTEDYELPEEQRKPYKTRTFDLKELLQRPVIENPPDRL